MKTASTYIISACAISNGIVLKNNKQLFSANENMHGFFAALYHSLNIDYPKFYKMDNLCKLGWLASDVLLKDENMQAYNLEKIGLVLSNANASLDADLKYFETAKQFASPALFVYTLPNIVMGEICIRNKFKGENAFFVFENFNAAFIQQYVAGLFDRNIFEACICGWVDVLEENYKAVLFLIGSNKAAECLLFNEENMNNIFKWID